MVRACWITDRDSRTLDCVDVRIGLRGFSARNESIRWTRSVFVNGSCGGCGSDVFVVWLLEWVRWDDSSGVIIVLPLLRFVLRNI